MVQYRVALRDVVHSVHNGVDRHTSHVLRAGLPVFCGYASGVPDLPPDGISDRARERHGKAV